MSSPLNTEVSSSPLNSEPGSPAGLARATDQAQMGRRTEMDERLKLLRETTTRLANAQAEVMELSRTRRRLVQELHAEGLSYGRIAEAAGLGRTRIHQIRHAGPGPEGAFFGATRVTIATPLKREAANARPVVAAEDFAVTQRLSELARHLGLDPDLQGQQTRINRYHDQLDR